MGLMEDGIGECICGCWSRDRGMSVSGFCYFTPSWLAIRHAIVWGCYPGPPSVVPVRQVKNDGAVVWAEASRWLKPFSRVPQLGIPGAEQD